jgi:hypothetical protein
MEQGTVTNCSTSCTTKDHATFGACMRAKNLQLNPNLSDTSKSKRFEGDLQRYRDVRGQGIQPAGTSAAQIQKAEEMSQRMGQAYDANKPMFDVAVG